MFPQDSDQVLRGRSCLLFGDFVQLPPVMDLPLYTTSSSSSLSDIGSQVFQMFDHAVVLYRSGHETVRTRPQSGSVSSNPPPSQER